MLTNLQRTAVEKVLGIGRENNACPFPKVSFIIVPKGIMKSPVLSPENYIWATGPTTGPKRENRTTYLISIIKAFMMWNSAFFLIIFPDTFEFVYNEHVRHKLIYTLKVISWAKGEVLMYMWHLLTHSFTFRINYWMHSTCQALRTQNEALCKEV